MVNITAHDDRRLTCECERQIFVVLGVSALTHGGRMLDPIRSNDNQIQNALAVLGGDIPIELLPKEDFPILVLDFLREQSRLGSFTARKRARSGRLSAFRAAETSVEASTTTIKSVAQIAMTAAQRRSPSPSGPWRALRVWPQRSPLR